MDLIPKLGPACPYCAKPSPQSDYLICGTCIKNPPYYDNALVAYAFEEPLRSLLHQFKYHHQLYLCSFFGRLIVDAWKQKKSMPQCLIPVPMHPKKLKERGFNQTVLVAKYLGKALNIPYNRTSCQKIRPTKAQASLNGDQRRTNLKNAFHLQPIPYTHVALIDDLLTTGSTANELARTLKKAGVSHVEIWCSARTI
jgi:ComF family protein